MGELHAKLGVGAGMLCVMAGCGAWSRCRWAAGPGQVGHRQQAPTDGRPPRGLQGLAAVPVGGGWAWPGFEIDHSEPPGSRVAISRAGRRPPAHTAARPNNTGHAAAGNLSGRRQGQAGGPPPTGTYSGPTQQHRPRGGRKSVRATSNARHQTGPRQHEAARPHRGRAAHASGR